MDKVAEFIHEGIQIAVDANNTLAAQAGTKGKAATNSKVMASIFSRHISHGFERQDWLHLLPDGLIGTWFYEYH